MLPDILERDADLSAKQVKILEKFVDRKLQSLASEVDKAGLASDQYHELGRPRRTFS